ncbi:MAG: NAD(P)/FAD-dependent oxidoreductase [Candidatus Aminicenantes bacterium]|nr:NAD(P)/FAD-dependent oxidoreductase [Candidatus Aminicenantes bacterium]
MAETTQVTVIGGGSSGLMAAVSASRAGAEIVLLERLDRVGKKLLATGNGRCNLSNADCSLSRFYGGDPAFIAQVLTRFPVASTIDFFEALGIACKTEDQGKIYPQSDQASAVLDVLRWELDRLHVEVRTGCEVTGIARAGAGFALSLSGGKEIGAGRVILAGGGKAGPQFGSDGSGLRLAQKLGHHLIEPLAAIVALRLGAAFLRRLKGVKFVGRVEVRCGDDVLRQEAGEILFTDNGVSGPPVLQLSRTAAVALQQNKAPRIVLDLFPDSGLEELDAALANRFRLQGHKSLAMGLVGLLNKRLIPVLLAEAGIPDPSLPCGALPAQERQRLAALLKGWSFPVVGTQPWPQAQVTAGGIALDEVDPATLESRLVPGLYFCGEILDVDGDCGGFNLQWAWSSGWLAGRSAASR